MSYRQTTLAGGFAPERGAGLTNSRFAAQVLNSADIASIIADAFKFDADLSRSITALNETNTYLSANVLKSAQATSKIATLTARDMLKQALTDLPQSLAIFNQRIRNQAIQSSAGYRLTATILGQQNKIWAQFNNIDMFSKMLFDLPESFAERQVRRFYNAEFALERVNDRDAWILYRNGLLKADYIRDSYRLEEGLPLADAEKIMKVRDWQIGKPSIRDAWRWVRKNLVDKEYFYKLCQLGYGFTRIEADIIFEDYDYDPSVGDVMSLSTLIPVPSEWADKAFDKAGFKPSDKALFKEALEKKTIKDEIRGIWGSILAFYQYGMYTDAQIEALLVGWKYSKPEIAIKLETCKLYRGKYVSQLMRDANIYLYRKTQLTEQELYDRFIAMGISQDVSNAITRNEACKQGIDWELPPP